MRYSTVSHFMGPEKKFLEQLKEVMGTSKNTFYDQRVGIRGPYAQITPFLDTNHALNICTNFRNILKKLKDNNCSELL